MISTHKISALDSFGTANCSLSPGCYVQLGGVRSLGTIIAIVAVTVTVLWSHQPITIYDEIIEFQRKLYTALGIPKEYLGYSHPTTTQLKK